MSVKPSRRTLWKVKSETYHKKRTVLVTELFSRFEYWPSHAILYVFLRVGLAPPSRSSGLVRDDW